MTDITLDSPPLAVLQDYFDQLLTQPAPAAAGDWLANGRPHWAQQRFEVLPFEVSGLTLAVPLSALDQVQPLVGDLIPQAGQGGWFLQLKAGQTAGIAVLNTARLVMPAHYSDDFLHSARHVISVRGLPWGLLACAVEQPLSIEPGGVNWRTDRGLRPWLAGVAKKPGCALLDISAMGRMLECETSAQSSGGKPSQ
ncbi:MAG: chemotaxis protein CheW [Gammaproteobacteria bacterium]|nr:chemotaxis protein CheW [Gammaproteobacteria bacterium]